MNGSSPFASPSVNNIPLDPPPDPSIDPAGYLRSLHSVRERSRIIHEKAKRNHLIHFDVDHTKFEDTAAYVVSIIKVNIHLSLEDTTTSS